MNSHTKSHPVAWLKPNDLGLFDMHGNDWEWPLGAFKPYAKGEKEIKDIEDIEDIKDIKSMTSRVLRGGSFDLQSVNVRCTTRAWIVPTHRNYNVGFRPARTFTP